MRKIVYYVAMSLDGYIAGQNDDVSGFIYDGSGVAQYLNELKDFDTVMMGRNTYEFGYKFGMQPGQPAYPHMKHCVFSNGLTFEKQAENVKVCKPDVAFVQELKNESGTDIYLCGGGAFAGWLLEHELIDILKIKLNPLILGKGVRLFGNSTKELKTSLIGSQTYDKGLQIIEYQINY